jgi:SAM-dependent methyltransferase
VRPWEQSLRDTRGSTILRSPCTIRLTAVGLPVALPAVYLQLMDPPRILSDFEDAFGQHLLDAVAGSAGEAQLERDDGSIGPAMAAADFLLPYTEWAPAERQVFDQIRGRVLDVGCGAGRHSLEAQNRGLEVVAIDISPGAVAVSRSRGVRDVRLLPMAKVDERLGTFDSVLMMCGNFGLAGSAGETERWLRRMHRLTSPRGRILLDTVDPYVDADAQFLAYMARNRARGALPGQVTIRIRHGERVTPWLDLILVSESELTELARRAGWRVGQIVSGEPPDLYAVLEKT